MDWLALPAIVKAGVFGADTGDEVRTARSVCVPSTGGATEPGDLSFTGKNIMP